MWGRSYVRVIEVLSRINVGDGFMDVKNWKTKSKKLFKYLGVGGLATLLVVFLGWGRFPIVEKMAKVDAGVPNSPAVQVSLRDGSELVQEGLQYYQSGQFAAAV